MMEGEEGYDVAKQYNVRNDTKNEEVGEERGRSGGVLRYVLSRGVVLAGMKLVVVLTKRGMRWRKRKKRQKKRRDVQQREQQQQYGGGNASGDGAAGDNGSGTVSGTNNTNMSKTESDERSEAAAAERANAYWNSSPSLYAKVLEKEGKGTELVPVRVGAGAGGASAEHTSAQISAANGASATSSSGGGGGAGGESRAMGAVTAEPSPSTRGPLITSAAAAAGAATLTASAYVNAGGARLGQEWAPVLVCVSLVLSVFAAVRRVGQLKMSAATSLLGTTKRIEGGVPATKKGPADETSAAGTTTGVTTAHNVGADELQVFLARLEGTFVRNNRKSDALDEICDLLRMNWLVRKAVLLVRGIEITTSPDEIKFDIFSVIPWFRVTETYPLNGDPRQHKRRDLRGGVNEGSVRLWRRVGGDGSGDLCVELRNRWNDPHAGEESAVYSLVKRATKKGAGDNDNDADAGRRGSTTGRDDEEEYDLIVETYARVFANGQCTYIMHGERAI